MVNELIETTNQSIKRAEHKDIGKVLKVKRDTEGVDYYGLLDRVVQYIDIADTLKKIKTQTKLVVQIPVKYQKQYESGEYFINYNKTTGVEWPTLMKMSEQGRWQFVDDLPIKREEFSIENPFREISMNFHNIYMQNQIAKLSDTVTQTLEIVKRIEINQEDDRITLIDTGREEILTALTLKDEEDKKLTIINGRKHLLLGKNRIGKSLQRRVEEFRPLPKNSINLFLHTYLQREYLNKRDEEVEKIQYCYAMYLEATKLLAASYAYTDDISAVEQVFRDSSDFISKIDFTKIKTIEYSHKNKDMSNMFYNHAVNYIDGEKIPCFEEAKRYDYISIETNSEDLLEVLENGRK